MREIIKVATRLLIICTVAGLCLAVTFGFTDPEIKKQEAQAETAAFVSLFPQAASYEPMTYDQAANPAILKLTAIKDGSGTLIGYCVNTRAKGFKAPIPLTVAFSVEGSIVGVRVGVNSETMGLGSLVGEPAYYEQYTGKTSPLALGQDITPISGATISSRAVMAAVNAAGAFVLTLP